MRIAHVLMSNVCGVPALTLIRLWTAACVRPNSEAPTATDIVKLVHSRCTGTRRDTVTAWVTAVCRKPPSVG